MPQMAPLSWVMLFFTFSLLLVLSVIKIYFSPKIEVSQHHIFPTPNHTNEKQGPMNWKW